MWLHSGSPAREQKRQRDSECSPPAVIVSRLAMQKPHTPPICAGQAELFLPRPGCCAFFLPEMPEVLFQGVSRVHRRYVGQGEVLQLREVSESRPLQKNNTTTAGERRADS